MENNNTIKGSTVFALDIGTRSVVGLLGSIENEKIIVHHSAMEFHRERAMYDGQIHDIEGVSKIVRSVKEKLEEQAGYKLDEVAIAAAGRSLKTYQTSIEKKIDMNMVIDRHLINALEIEGLQQAQKLIQEEDIGNKDYLCVGHSIVNYYLNGGLITNPIGHRGERVSAEILATFLPQIVVDGLHSVMSSVGLEVSFMTLEPIAAIEVAVPQNVRLLNIALVDIGAGTSDIAITKDGTIIAYAMTSTAGDEITETIAKTYLMDFDRAEELKCNLYKKDIQHFTDIMGMSRELSTLDILESIHLSIESISKDIADSIIAQNGKAPSAVFLIGGGSQIPRLPELIAGYLGIPKERVSLRGIETIQNLNHNNTILTGPEGITPIGILVKAIRNKMTDFVSIKVNEKHIKLFQSKKLRVSDALVMAGFNPRELIPKKGSALSILINGQKETFYGEYGEPARIYINSKQGNLENIIKDGDVITIVPAESGKPVINYVENVIKKEEGFVLNGQYIDSVSNIRINGKELQEKQILAEGDRVEYKKIKRIDELCEVKAIDVNQYNIYVNGQLVDENFGIKNNDKIVLISKEKQVEFLKDHNNFKEHIVVNYNGSNLKIPRVKDQILFVDIFNFVDFDRTKVQGKLVLKHNGKYANYTDKLCNDDYVEVYWEKMNTN